MKSRLRAVVLAGVAFTLALLLSGTPGLGAQTAPVLADVLRLAGAYLDDYQRQMSAIVSEEEARQYARENSIVVTKQRRLRSDMLVLMNAFTGWVVFRDVFEVDGRPVRDRDTRLSDLFLKPHADTLQHARRIANEGARFNLQPRNAVIVRTLNNPMAALRFLLPENQARSTFRIEGTRTIERVSTVVVRFFERDKPRILISDDQAPGSGRFWIEASTGRIVESELFFDTVTEGRSAGSTIRVTFAPDAKVGMWVPVAMHEEYRLGRDYAAIEARATYSNFRKFTVDVETIIKQ